MLTPKAIDVCRHRGEDKSYRLGPLFNSVFMLGMNPVLCTVGKHSALGWIPGRANVCILHFAVTAEVFFSIFFKVVIGIRGRKDRVFSPQSAKWNLLCGFLQDSISLLLEAVRTRNEELAQTWKKSEQWATIEQLCSKCSLSPV